MTAVVISRSLTAEMGEEFAYQFARDFKAYKSDQAENYGVIFGRDKGFLYPDIVVKNGLQHVHLVQESVLSDWKQRWIDQEPQENFTSNKILVYGQMTEVSFTPHLLLTILDPGGHAQMSDIERMKAVGEEFEEEYFRYSSRLPSDKWVIVK